MNTILLTICDLPVLIRDDSFISIKEGIHLGETYTLSHVKGKKKGKKDKGNKTHFVEDIVLFVLILILIILVVIVIPSIINRKWRPLQKRIRHHVRRLRQWIERRRRRRAQNRSVMMFRVRREQRRARSSRRGLDLGRRWGARLFETRFGR